MSKKVRVALISLIASIAMTAAKLIVGLAIGSLALVTDALHSATDVVATLVTLTAVRFADKPADDDHPYGHGKFENVAALGEATLLLLLAGGVSVEAWTRLGDGHAAPEAGVIAFVVMAVEIAVNAWRAWALHKTAQETGSRALAADALHFASDVGSSIAVVIGLVAVLFGIEWADPVAAMAVAVLVAVLGLRMIRGTVDELTDRVAPGVIRGLEKLVASLPGVVAVDHVRVRHVGAQTFVDVAAQVPRTFAFDEIVAVKQRIQDGIAGDYPGAEVTSSCTPAALDDETVRQRVLLAAGRLHIPIHHVTIQHLGDRLSVSLDLEVDGAMPLGAAHEVASGLEDAVRAEIGAEIEVETHLEPLYPDLLPGEAVDGRRASAIAAALAEAAEEYGVCDVHNVRVRELGDEGVFVAFHCRFPGSFSAQEVHRRADALERHARSRFPEIRRIVSHPEPIRG